MVKTPLTVNWHLPYQAGAVLWSITLTRQGGVLNQVYRKKTKDGKAGGSPDGCHMQ